MYFSLSLWENRLLVGICHHIELKLPLVLLVYSFFSFADLPSETNQAKDCTRTLGFHWIQVSLN